MKWPWGDPIAELIGIYGTTVKGTALNSFQEGMLAYGGLVGNRVWVPWDVERKCVLTAKIRATSGLLQMRSRHGEVFDEISAPGGEWLCCELPQAENLIADLTRGFVRLVRIADSSQPTATNFQDFVMPPGQGVDGSSVLGLTTQSLEAIGMSVAEGVARYRPTLLFKMFGNVGKFPEDDWEWQFFLIGNTVMVGKGMKERCPLPAWPMLGLDGDVLPANPRALQAVKRLAPGDTKPRMWLGAGMSVVRPGPIAVGDLVYRRLP